MSELEHYFQLLVDAISGHFSECRQKRINKHKLLKLLFERMNFAEKCNSIVLSKAYIEHFGGSISGLPRAINRAVEMIKTWFKTYYDSHNNLPIRFEIGDDFILRAIIADGFEDLGIPELVKRQACLLEQICELSTLAKQLFHGQKAQAHSGHYSEVLLELQEATTSLNRVSAAIRRRQ